MKAIIVIDVNNIDQGYPCSAYDEGYGDGWDGCINEILGEQG